MNKSLEKCVRNPVFPIGIILVPLFFLSIIRYNEGFNERQKEKVESLKEIYTEIRDLNQKSCQLANKSYLEVTPHTTDTIYLYREQIGKLNRKADSIRNHLTKEYISKADSMYNAIVK